MSEQKVVRTNASNSSTYQLKVLLNDGYKVAHATKLSGDVIEYIVEKDGAEELVHDQEEVVRFIHNRISKDPDFDFVSMGSSLKLIKKVLELDEDYMRNKGIIED